FQTRTSLTLFDWLQIANNPSNNDDEYLKEPIEHASNSNNNNDRSRKGKRANTGDSNDSNSNNNSARQDHLEANEKKKKPVVTRTNWGDTEEMESDVAVATKNANMANHYKPELEHCNCYSRIHKHYCNILKRPMDLSTINEKMKNGKYTDAAMFAKGVRKVWKHYLTFNTSGSPLYCVTDNLSKQFKKKFSRVLKYQTNGAYVRAEINTKTIISTIKNEEFMP
ncbi:hypothetical protein RFI_31123, partial [Reticulomyxa filosa]